MLGQLPNIPAGQVLPAPGFNTYDDAGNILTASDGSSSHTYTYGDAQWKDLLTAYDGHAITYDAIGNPTSWHDGTTFTWDLGRRLMSAENTASGLDNSYTYDSDGLRLTKTVGDVQHKYVWQGSRLVSENWAGQELEFFYDESGSPYAFSYKASATAAPVMYYYVTNLQGDVVNILDAGGNIKASYTYNAWGEILSATGDMADINPLRYRGYYFDSDTGLYYLKSRYYDPQLCRFINSDEYASTGQGILGINMFAYCLNNPANYIDSEGMSALQATLPAFAQYVPLLSGAALVLGGASLAVTAVVFAGVAIYYIGDAVAQAKKNSSSPSSQSSVDMGGGAASPTPPGNGNWNNRNNKGTNVTSKTLYSESGKRGVRVDVENPMTRPGQIHIQYGSSKVKYYYDISNNILRIGSSSGAPAPASVQRLLSDPNIMRAIAKGLRYLGY